MRMARSAWAARRYDEVMRRINIELGTDPEPLGRSRNHLRAGTNVIRLGFGRGQLSNQRGVKGFPKATTETYYLEVPGPVHGPDLVVTVLGEKELVFSGTEFLPLAGPFAEKRYLPNFFRDTRDGRYWARVASYDVNYPLDDYVEAWPSRRPVTLPDTIHDDVSDPHTMTTDLLAGFKPGNAGDYRAHIEGRDLTKSRSHERLVADFALWTADAGFAPSTVEYPRDLVLRGISGQTILVEGKVLYRGNATQAVRAAIGQLFTYRHLLHRGDSIDLLALFSEPIGDEFVGLLTSLGIAAAWRDSTLSWRCSELAVAIGLPGMS
jgi:hypothetical protein